MRILIALLLLCLSACGQEPSKGHWGDQWWSATLTQDGKDYNCTALTAEELAGNYGNNCGPFGSAGACQKWWSIEIEHDGVQYGCRPAPVGSFS